MLRLFLCCVVSHLIQNENDRFDQRGELRRRRVDVSDAEVLDHPVDLFVHAWHHGRRADKSATQNAMAPTKNIVTAPSKKWVMPRASG
jgi:hypothetical protein